MPLCVVDARQAVSSRATYKPGQHATSSIPPRKRVMAERAKADQHSVSDFLMACEEGDLERVKQLMGKKPINAAVDKNGCNGLMLAAWGGHDLLIDPLVQSGSNVDHRDYAGRTPLMRAAQWGHTRTISQLVRLKAAVDGSDSNGCTALTLAAQWGHNDVIEVLLKAGAAVDREDKNDCTALTWAAREGRSDVIERLLAAGAVVDQKNNDGGKPSSFASCDFTVNDSNLLSQAAPH